MLLYEYSTPLQQYSQVGCPPVSTLYTRYTIVHFGKGHGPAWQMMHSVPGTMRALAAWYLAALDEMGYLASLARGLYMLPLFKGMVQCWFYTLDVALHYVRV